MGFILTSLESNMPIFLGNIIVMVHRGENPWVHTLYTSFITHIIMVNYFGVNHFEEKIVVNSKRDYCYITERLIST